METSRSHRGTTLKLKKGKTKIEEANLAKAIDAEVKNIYDAYFDPVFQKYDG
jgi:hypothetical protein